MSWMSGKCNCVPYDINIPICHIVSKQVEITPEKIDKASKITGHLLFEVKNFKNKVQNEEKRLQDSTGNLGH